MGRDGPTPKNLPGTGPNPPGPIDLPPGRPNPAYDTMVPTIWRWSGTRSVSSPRAGLVTGLAPFIKPTDHQRRLRMGNFQVDLPLPGAFVYTTWTGRTPIADSIAASQGGMDCGAHHAPYPRHHDRHPGLPRRDQDEGDNHLALHSRRLRGRRRERLVGFASCSRSARGSGGGVCAPMVREGRSRAWTMRSWRVSRRVVDTCQEATVGNIRIKLEMPGHRNEGDSVTGKTHDKL